jgi:hypothetical protein
MLNLLVLMSLSCLLSAKDESLLTLAWLRVEQGVHHLKSAQSGRFLAFVDENGHNLQVVDTQKKESLLVSPNSVGPSFFFSPDGHRLFFKEHYSVDKNVHSRILAYDMGHGGYIPIKTVEHATGFLSFNPNAQRMNLYTKDAIISQKLVYPDQRLARWQLAHRTDLGEWVITPTQVLWLRGPEVVKAYKFNVDSFDIAANGQDLVFATKDQRIMYSKAGSLPSELDRGLDPRWHPHEKQIVYAKAQMIGEKLFQTDLALLSPSDGLIKKLTQTSERSERWPQWNDNGTHVLFAIDKSTDIHTVQP